MTELRDSGELDIIKRIKKFIISNPESKKSRFFILSASNEIYDDVIIYLVRIIHSLLRKRKLTDEEEQLLQPYFNFKKVREHRRYKEVWKGHYISKNIEI